LNEPQRRKIGLPPRPFLYTLDQICVLIELNLFNLKRDYIYFEGRSIGIKHPSLMSARNIAEPDQPPDWRVAERELIRWMRHKGWRYYDSGSFSG
jgi:hypothetical protein